MHMVTFVLTSPMHWPTHGQWWSNFWTQLLQMEQCEDRGGRYLRQVSQNLSFTVKPFTMTSFVRRNLIRGVPPILHSIDGVVGRFRSSASGGGALVFRGTIPGSLADVMNRKNRSYKCFGQYETGRSFSAAHGVYTGNWNFNAKRLVDVSFRCEGWKGFCVDPLWLWGMSMTAELMTKVPLKIADSKDEH
jgi:hypothetical protein